MITKKKTTWCGMLFELKGCVLPQLLPRLFILFLYTIVIVYFRDSLLKYHLFINSAIFTLFGIALAIFLGFRNTVSYDRFWEGRKLWGALLNDTRSLARQAHKLVDGEDYHKQRTHFIQMLTALVYALKHQLRETNPDTDMNRLLSKSDNQKTQTTVFKPIIIIIILKELGLWVNKLKRDGKLDSNT
jgi:putative membrane protein